MRHRREREPEDHPELDETWSYYADREPSWREPGRPRGDLYGSARRGPAMRTDRTFLPDRERGDHRDRDEPYRPRISRARQDRDDEGRFAGMEERTWDEHPDGATRAAHERAREREREIALHHRTDWRGREHAAFDRGFDQRGLDRGYFGPEDRERWFDAARSGNRGWRALRDERHARDEWAERDRRERDRHWEDRRFDAGHRFR
ncbi:MAG: hypothetical protein ACTHU0_25260 [Kofleriaceae bacterium]